MIKAAQLRIKDINIKVLHDAEEYQIATYNGEYRNLMMLLYDKIYIENFGECKGMGRCGTCMVEIIETKNVLAGLARNEEATIKKTGVTHPDCRLACQILVTEELKNAVVRIYDAHHLLL
jgi:2Fe-2S ferredoxin